MCVRVRSASECQLLDLVVRTERSSPRAATLCLWAIDRRMRVHTATTSYCEQEIALMS